MSEVTTRRVQHGYRLLMWALLLGAIATEVIATFDGMPPQWGFILLAAFLGLVAARPEPVDSNR